MEVVNLLENAGQEFVDFRMPNFNFSRRCGCPISNDRYHKAAGEGGLDKKNVYRSQQ